MSWAEIMIAIKRGIVASAESVANIISGATAVGNAKRLRSLTREGEDYGTNDFLLKAQMGAIGNDNNFGLVVGDGTYGVKVNETDTVDGRHASEFVLENSIFFQPGETIFDWAVNPNGIYRKFIVSPTFPSDAPIEMEGFLELNIDESGNRKMVIFRVYGTLNEYKREMWLGKWQTEYWYNGFNADMVDGHHADEFLMVSSYKYIIDSLRADTDNRNVQTQPNDYNSVFKVAGLKNNEAIGLTGTGTEYSFVVGIRGWVDFSGGDAHEIAFCSNGKLYHRHGATDAWYGWSVLMDSNMTVPVVVSATAPADTTAVWIVP